jgi:hypothetical protein
VFTKPVYTQIPFVSFDTTLAYTQFFKSIEHPPKSV